MWNSINGDVIKTVGFESLLAPYTVYTGTYGITLCIHYLDSLMKIWIEGAYFLFKLRCVWGSWFQEKFAN